MKITPSESTIQKQVMTWVRYAYPRISKLIFHVPNGGSRNKIEAAKMKGEGVTAGVADIIVLIPAKGYGCLCIELKAEKGKQSEHQKEFEKQTKAAGNAYVLCRSYEAAVSAINDYLKI